MYDINHWDTFDNELIKIASKHTLQEAEDFVEEYYKGRINDSGADKVEIVVQGKIVKSYSVS
jgi:hypothetical protein